MLTGQAVEMTVTQLVVIVFFWVKILPHGVVESNKMLLAQVPKPNIKLLQTRLRNYLGYNPYVLKLVSSFLKLQHFGVII
jgi:hypothetical protein